MIKDVSLSKKEKLILGYLSYFNYLSTSQIESVAFGSPYGLKVCQRTLKCMYEKKQVNRFRFEREFIYYLNRKNQGWQSIVLLNKLYFDIKAKGKIIKYQPEMEFFSGRCDGFFVAEFQDKRKKFFVEVDRGTAPFKKASIYNTLLQTDWEGEWWADPLKRGVISFPLVVVLTMRQHIVERDFIKAKFLYHILDLYEPKWENIFKGDEHNDNK